MSTHTFTVSIDAGANWGIVDAVVTYSAFEGGNWHRLTLCSVIVQIVGLPTEYIDMLTGEQLDSLESDAWSDFRERSVLNSTHPGSVKPQPAVGKNTGSSALELPTGDNTGGSCGLTTPIQGKGAAFFKRLAAKCKIFMLRIEYGMLMVDAYLADQRDDKKAAQFWANQARKRQSEIELISLNQRYGSPF